MGDDKSPADWHLEGVVFLSVADQLALPFIGFARLVPQRNYARKAVGYLYALQHGAKLIYESDDDNAPKPGEWAALGGGLGLRWVAGWGCAGQRLAGARAKKPPQKPALPAGWRPCRVRPGPHSLSTTIPASTPRRAADLGLSWIASETTSAAASTSGRGAVNPYAYFGECASWPRGYPLTDLLKHGAEHCYNITGSISAPAPAADGGASIWVRAARVPLCRLQPDAAGLAPAPVCLHVMTLAS